MRMPTDTPDIRPFHRTAVLNSIELVAAVRPAELDAPTPCAGWTLADLLAHMTVQHHGFAMAARGYGADAELWRPESVIDAVRTDPATTYADAARDVLEAFADDAAPDASFALPEFGPGATFPGAIAMGFHFIDYVVHGWDVAAALGVPYVLPADVVGAALPLALAVPDGEFRALDEVPFGPAIQPATGDDLDRILRHLGRRPDWAQAYSTVTGA
nr:MULTISPECIES: TIGR03086 family metal-binding protein [unclassified Mycobacterium]